MTALHVHERMHALYFDEASQRDIDVAVAVDCVVNCAHVPLPEPGLLELNSAPNGMALTLHLGGRWPSLTVRFYLQRALRRTNGWDVYWHIPGLDIGLVVVV